MLNRRKFIVGVASATVAVAVRSSSAGATTLGEIAVRAARSQLGVPYKWDAETPGVGFDCSGLTAWAWRQAGIEMDSYTVSQAAAFREISSDQIVPGDLVFNTSLGHVVIYAGNGRCIEARRTGTLVQESPNTMSALCVRPTLLPVRVVPSGVANGREMLIAEPGDSLNGIALARGIQLVPFARMNGLSPSSPLRPGDNIVLPSAVKTLPPPTSTPKAIPAAAASTYVVRPGDTLSGIAARFGMTVARLVKLNGIADSNRITPGIVLKLT